MTMPDDRYIENKYRVFHAPFGDDPGIGMTAYYQNGVGAEIEADEVDGFCFVLRPDVDDAAVVAIAAYAAAVSSKKPNLSKDLFTILEDLL